MKLLTVNLAHRIDEFFESHACARHMCCHTFLPTQHSLKD